MKRFIIKLLLSKESYENLKYVLEEYEEIKRVQAIYGLPSDYDNRHEDAAIAYHLSKEL